MPTEEERIEYLLTRVRKTERRPAFEKFALEHVLSYQKARPRHKVQLYDEERGDAARHRP